MYFIIYISGEVNLSVSFYVYVQIRYSFSFTLNAPWYAQIKKKKLSKMVQIVIPMHERGYSLKSRIKISYY